MHFKVAAMQPSDMLRDAAAAPYLHQDALQSAQLDSLRCRLDHCPKVQVVQLPRAVMPQVQRPCIQRQHFAQLYGRCRVHFCNSCTYLTSACPDCLLALRVDRTNWPLRSWNAGALTRCYETCDGNARGIEQGDGRRKGTASSHRHSLARGLCRWGNSLASEGPFLVCR